MTKNITDQRLIDVVRKVVSGKEGRTYASLLNEGSEHRRCMALSNPITAPLNQYSYEDCVAGCVIEIIAPKVHKEMLALEVERGISWSLGMSTEVSLAIEAKLPLTDEQFQALRVLQREQDAGRRWGTAEGVFLERLGGQ